jgi:hypothetical protein
MQMNLRLPLLVCAVALLLAGTAVAGITTYSGFDDGAGARPLPNSDAAALAFDTATGNLPIITFESAPLGYFSSLVVAPGVTVTGTDYYGNQQSIINAPICAPALCGFNTTIGGSQWLNVYGGFATFTFSHPISAFGAYITGNQVAGINLAFNDGSQQSIPIPVDYSNGGAAFVGFTDSLGNITSVSVMAVAPYGDFIGVDDVRYSGSTPEPGSILLLGTGLLGAASLLRRKLL